MGCRYAGIDWASDKHDVLVADQNGVALLTKQLKMEGILPKGISTAALNNVKMALALAIEQLAANTLSRMGFTVFGENDLTE